MANSHLIRTAELADSTFSRRDHPIDPSKSRFQLPIGDLTGLTRTGVHLCRLPPHTTSSTLHWHSHEDEWFYVVEAGDDAVVLIKEDRGADEPTETTGEPIKKGDFLGFPAGVRKAHAFRTGGSELVYLVGGSREPLDISHYPESGKMRFNDTTEGGTSYIVDSSHAVVHQLTKK